MGKLYTIGHSTFPMEHFIELLEMYEINYVLDVRSIPFSRFTPQYNSNAIQIPLKEKGISYAQMGKFFGARQSDEKYYPEGYLDFELFRASELFKKGLENVVKGLEHNNIALMCTEKNPIDCHRAIMVARGFELEGINVKHILHDFSVLEHNELNNVLLDKYFPNRAQLSFIEEENKSEEEYTIEAYRKRNYDIGYRFGSDIEGGE